MAETSNVPQKQLTIEQASYEQLIASNSAKTLAGQLHLTETQIAKANTKLLQLLDDDKLEGCTKLSKLRFCYRVATLNYKQDNAVAPVKYGNSVQAQLQDQALIEDMKECGGVEESNCVCLFKDIDYKPHVNKLGFTELDLPEEIKLDNPFQKLEIIGYYAYAKCVDGRTATCVMSKQEVEEYALKKSISYKSFKKGNSKSAIWDDEFDKMALKTVLKAVARTVLKWFPYDRLSASLSLDQTVFTETGEKYADNPQSQSIGGSKVLKPDEELVVDVTPQPTTPKEE